MQKESVADTQTQSGAGPLAVTWFAGQLPSEQILWAGRPSPLTYVYRRLWPAFPFGVIVLAFTALWELNAVSNGHHRVWAVSGLLFLFAGLLAGLLRPVLLFRFARRRVYAVTDRRVVRLRRSGRRELVVESEWVWRPPFAAVRVPPGGGRISVADVTFAGPPARAGRWGWWGIGEDGDVLACLADAPAALAALAQLRAGSAAPAGAWAGGVQTP